MIMVMHLNRTAARRGLLFLAFLAVSACASPLGGAVQPPATLTLAAAQAADSPRLYNFHAEIVGGADNDSELYCVATTWDFGDGPSLTFAPSCVPWTPDIKIQRRFDTSHTYAGSGRYAVTLVYGHLTAKATVDVP